MGRQVKQRRSRKVRQNPILAANSSQDRSETSSNAAIIKKLQSTDAHERTWAATAISQLVLDETPRQLLLESDVTSQLESLLSDPSPAVIIEALGALRNIAIVDEEACFSLCNATILQILKSLSDNVSKQDLCLDDELDAEAKIREISGDALLVGLELIPSLLILFKKETGAPASTREVIGQVLLLCVDENPPSIPICDEMKVVLEDNSEDISIRILAASILSYSNDYFYAVLPILSSCLEGDWESWMNQAQELANPNQDNLDENIAREIRKYLDEKSSKLEVKGAHLRICQLACESLANMFSRDDNDCISEQELQNWIHFTFTHSNLIVSLLRIGNIRGPQLLNSNAILRTGDPLAPELLNPSLKEIYSDWKLLQNRCFGTLSNIFILVDERTSKGIPISDFWNQLNAINQCSKHDEEALKSILETMSALIQSAPLYSFTPTAAQIQNFIAQYRFYPSIRVYIIMILGVIGRFQGNIEMNKEIGEFLLTEISSSDSNIVIMESLNAIFDIYADKDFDYDGPVFIQLEFLSLLKRLVSNISFKLSGDSDGQDCLENLGAFIEYKESEVN